MMEAWKVIVFLCLIAVPIISGYTYNEGGRPSFCKSLQCPNFTVIRTEPDYQLRRYERTTWVVTEKQNEWFAETRMFRRLANYTLQGANNLGLKMPMTAPVLTETSDTEPKKMYFMLPDDRQSRPPAPTDPLVTIKRMPSMMVYVREFSGYAFDSDWDRELQTLRQDLCAEGATYNRHMRIRAGYDSPFTLFNRHNEIWVLAE